jgi:hypothetical protein
MRVEASHTTVAGETIERFRQEQASRAERQILQAGSKAGGLEAAADELVGTTFFAALLQQTERGGRKKGYFADTGAGRFFARQLHLELAKRVSLSKGLHVGRMLTARLRPGESKGTES